MWQDSWTHGTFANADIGSSVTARGKADCRSSDRQQRSARRVDATLHGTTGSSRRNRGPRSLAPRRR